VAGDPAKIEGGTAVKETVPVAQATHDEAVLPERVQEALGELVGAAKEGLLALSVGVGLGVLSSMMEEESCATRRCWIGRGVRPRRRAVAAARGS
jgi:hypothetical protein